MLDIRTPIGTMFLILGALLAVYGLSTSPEVYRISLGYNLNLLWGSAMALFGLGMLAWMRLSPAGKREGEAELTATVPADRSPTLH